MADPTEDPDTNNNWEDIKTMYVETATMVLGYRRRENKEWLTPDTRKKIEERREIKAKMLCTKSPRFLERIQEAYREKGRQVKKSAKRDKRTFVEYMADKAEQAAARGEMSTIYNITKKLSRKYTSKSASVKDKDRNILKPDQEQTARWAQHFREVLNCTAPDSSANPPPSENILNIDTSPPTNE